LFKSRPGGISAARVAVGAGGKVTSEAVNTDPTAEGVGRALTTLVEVLEDTVELDEAWSDLAELLVILLETDGLETGFDDVVAFDEVIDCFVDEADDIFLVEEEICVDFVEVVTREGVAVTALQT
jgi:hypothetical protein